MNKTKKEQYTVETILWKRCCTIDIRKLLSLTRGSSARVFTHAQLELGVTVTQNRPDVICIILNCQNVVAVKLTLLHSQSQCLSDFKQASFNSSVL